MEIVSHDVIPESAPIASDNIAKPPGEADPTSSEWSEEEARLLQRIRESVPNTPLEPSEREGIVGQVQALLQAFADTQERVEAVQKTVDEMRKADERIGRKDLLILGIGAITTLAISAAFPPHTVVQMTKMFIHVVAKELGGPLSHFETGP